MRAPIRRIVITGGGTAGWLSAAYLNRALGESVEITLIESSDVDTVGVGEATIPTLGVTMRFLGFQDRDWMPHVQGTYKAAIKFAGWSPASSDHYWHPFSRRPEPAALPYDDPYFLEIGGGFSLLHYALERRIAGDRTDLVSAVSPSTAVCLDRLTPVDDSRPELSVRTAYHLDAGLFARFLRKVATARGVRHEVAHIEDVKLDERGYIHSVVSRDGRAFEGDLFVDCSGFRSLLLNSAMGVPFDRDPYLLCDSAVAIQCQSNPNRDGIPPYTTATALGSGWVWDVPLFRRNGTGYVYCSSAIERDGAEAELREFLGERGEGASARHIRMRVGRAREAWRNNCVAVGLSGSFLEPLESTGIFLIEFALANLVRFFPDRDFEPAVVRRFNDVMAQTYEELRDFLVLHYCLNQRTDGDLWPAVREERLIPDSLRGKLALFRDRLELASDGGFGFFRLFSYACILDGCGALPRRGLPMLQHLGRDAGEAALQEVAAQRVKMRGALPGHHEYLQRMYASVAGVVRQRPSAAL